MNPKKSDAFDESGLNFELNAAIESNPFSKRKNLLKDKTDKPPATQTTEVPEKKSYPAYTIQKPTTTTATQERTFEYKKPEPTTTPNITKEPITTQPEKPAITTTTGTYTPYQKGSYTSSYTRPEPQKTPVTTSYTASTLKSTPSQDEKPPVSGLTTTTTTASTRLGTATTSYNREPLPTTTPTTSTVQVEKPPVTSTTTTGTTGLRPPTVGQLGRPEPPKFTTTAGSTIPRPTPTTTVPITQPSVGVQQQQQQSENLNTTPVKYERPGAGVNRDGVSTAGIPQTGLVTSPATSGSLRSSTSGMVTGKAESDKPTSTYSTANPLKNYSPLTTQKTAGGVGAGYTPTRPTLTPGKTNLTTPTASGKPALNLNNIPRNILTSRNNNRGLMIINGKTNRNQTRDIQANYLGGLVEDVTSYPGPYKFEKKAMSEKYSELLGFIHRKLSDPNASVINRLCFTVLNEYLTNHSTSLFKDTAEQSRENICNEIFQYSDATLSNLTKEYREYFNISNDYLIGMGDLAFQDPSWEDVLFKSLFLRNTTCNIDSTNVDFVLNYVRNKYAPGDPIHTFSMVKLGFLHEIFETPFFLENNITDIWPLLVYPCLRFNSYLPVSSIIDFFNSLALKIAESKNASENSLLALFIALLTGDFDGETFNKICQNSKHPTFAQIVESYYFTLKINEASFDKNYNLVFLILPSTLSYAYYLLDLGAFDKAKEYLDYLISLRPFYQSLERDNRFLHRIRTMRDLVINHYTIIEEVREALTQGKFLANKKEEIKQTATQLTQKIQAKGKSLFGFVSKASSAFSSFMNANEGGVQEIKQSNTPTLPNPDSATIATSPSITTESKPIVPTQRPGVNVPPPNKGKPVEEEHPPVSFPSTVDAGMVDEPQMEKPDSAKLKGSVASPFGNPGAGAGTKPTGIKKIPQNRYVSPF